MENTSGCIRHLIEFIDTADTAVTQDKSTTGCGLAQGQMKLVDTNLSNTSCFESGSRVTYAVRPTADEPLPEVYTPRGAILCTYYNPKSDMCRYAACCSTHRKDLGFTDTRITDKQYIDVTSVPGSTGSTTTSDALVGTTKQLEEYTFLDILQGPDGRCK